MLFFKTVSQTRFVSYVLRFALSHVLQHHHDADDQYDVYGLRVQFSSRISLALSVYIILIDGRRNCIEQGSPRFISQCVN